MLSIYHRNHIKALRLPGAVGLHLSLARGTDRNRSGDKKKGWSQGSCLAVLVEQCGLYQHQLAWPGLSPAQGYEMKTRTSFDQSILGFLNPWTGAESDATYCTHSNTCPCRTQETCWLHHRRPRHRQRHGRTVDTVDRFSTLSWKLNPHIMPPALAGPQVRSQIRWPSRCLLQSWLTPARV